MVTFTLDKMARGGIYDQLGGGFHRYSVDAHLARAALREDALRQRPVEPRLSACLSDSRSDDFFRRIAEEIYDYILREMTSPEGGFLQHHRRRQRRRRGQVLRLEHR